LCLRRPLCGRTKTLAMASCWSEWVGLLVPYVTFNLLDPPLLSTYYRSDVVTKKRQSNLQSMWRMIPDSVGSSKWAWNTWNASLVHQVLLLKCSVWHRKCSKTFHLEILSLVE
jgi:hypothetical protein